MGGVYALQRSGHWPQATASAPSGDVATKAEVADLRTQLQQVQGTVTDLQGRAQAALAVASGEGGQNGADQNAVQDLGTRVAALEAKLTAPATQPGEGAQPGAGPADTAASGHLRDRLAALEGKVNTNSDAVNGKADATAIADLGKRVDQLQAAVGTGDQVAPDSLSGRLASLTDQFGQLRDSIGPTAISAMKPEIDQLGQRVDQMAGTVDQLNGKVQDTQTTAATTLANMAQTTTHVQQQLTEVTGTVAQLSDQVAHAAPSQKIDELTKAVQAAQSRADQAAAVAPVIAANGLVDAVQGGSSFATELKAVQTVTPGDAAIGTLEPYAASGLPRIADLKQGFDKVMASRVSTADLPAEGGGTLTRLLQSAKGVIKVTPAGPIEGNSSAAILSRIDADFDSGNLKGVLDEWNGLPQADKDATHEFIQPVQAHAAAIDLAGRLRANALGQLSSAK
ncbi:Uncharacterized conserved protein [Faunimonas pinastri]|uniref:Uncharacterized conserved protein n=1 Tax=Faunimonas pinastri TaxID=1855383 RepID=A0A1H9IR94_9HYPH|nr:hypothetical protein [Faunimonas pinastri]SEQ77037.1 Uncharacterized conserved protein [Faunimonas pinastri]